jgi:3-oxoacyl-[acyl-carrier-protein] synthase-1
MAPRPIAVHHTGLVTSIGLDTDSTCAALRASVTNPTETTFVGADGAWILAHQVLLGKASTDLAKLVDMASLAITECLEPLRAEDREGMPLLLCVAERERPGRVAGLDGQILDDVQAAVGVTFDPEHSAVIPMGRIGALSALERARRLIDEHGMRYVLIAGTDSLLVWRTLTAYSDQSRLLAEHNSNGFMPGEAAGAVLVGPAAGRPGELLCLGLGQGIEPAPLGSGEPLRADGLTGAIKQALREAGCAMHDLDFRITDISGEQYFFREASLAVSRTMHQPKQEFDLWHPAEGIGETGAAAGPAMIATALTACRKGYAKGIRILLHASSDADGRVAAIVAWTGAAR